MKNDSSSYLEMDKLLRIYVHDIQIFLSTKPPYSNKIL